MHFGFFLTRNSARGVPTGTMEEQLAWRYSRGIEQFCIAGDRGIKVALRQIRSLVFVGESIGSYLTLRRGVADGHETMDRRDLHHLCVGWNGCRRTVTGRMGS